MTHLRTSMDKARGGIISSLEIFNFSSLLFTKHTKHAIFIFCFSTHALDIFVGLFCDTNILSVLFLS